MTTKNTQPVWTKKNYATGLGGKNYATSLDKTKIKQPLWTKKKVTQPL